MRVAEALAQARALGLDRLDGRTLLAHHVRRPSSWLLAHDEEELGPETIACFLADAQRRAHGVPLAYLMGHKEFHGLEFQVSPQVLVPRPETEGLVDWALELLGERPHDAATLVDLGTGSGAIAVAIAHRHPSARVAASDVDAAALQVAQINARRQGVRVEFELGPWWTPWAGRHFDIVVSNPPYVAGGDPHLAALAHEPLLALTPGEDGLTALQAIVDNAVVHMNPRAWILLEHGWDQAAAVRAMLESAGFAEVQTRRDLAGHERCTGGRTAGAGEPWRSALP